MTNARGFTSSPPIPLVVKICTTHLLHKWPPALMTGKSVERDNQNDVIKTAAVAPKRS